MKISGDQTQPELVNLQPLGQTQPGGSLSIASVDCADDAPC
jgi:hypothetical protein